MVYLIENKFLDFNIIFINFGLLFTTLNKMKPIKLKLILYLILLSIFACSESKTTYSNKTNDDDIKIEERSKTTPLNSTIDYSSVLLIIKRGAFHYDKFILKDTIITFYPSSKNLGKEYDNYNQISEQKISKQTRNKFIKRIIEKGFFNLEDSYFSMTTCNSHLTVTLKFNNQSKKIFSEDFVRKCPELLKFIEQEMIQMHNKNLKRVLLPG